MLVYVIRRGALSLLVMFGVVTIVFAVIRLVPGDPLALMMDTDASPETIAAAQARYGLDQPILSQYLTYLSGVVQFDFGESIRFKQPAFDLVLERLGATVRLGLTAILLAVAISIPLGMSAARRAGTAWDTVVSRGSLLGQSLPPFWVAIMLLLIFARTLGWLPSVGSEGAANLILPAITLALPLVAILVRLVRQGVLEVLGSGYVETARAKGLRERTVMGKHVLKNTLIPVITVIGLQVGDVLTGAVIVETVFSWPGIGKLMVDSINARDYPLVQAIMLFISGVFVLVNFVVDIVYGYLDPRVRVEERTR